MNELHIVEFLSELGFSNAQAVARKDYFSNEDSERQIYLLNDKVVVKAYGRSNFDSYRMECAMGEVVDRFQLWAPQMLGFKSFDDAAYIVYEFSPGTTLNDVYAGMELSDYCEMARLLGSAIGKVHSVDTNTIDLPTIAENSSPNSESESRRRLSEFVEQNNLLAVSGLISSKHAARLRNAYDRVAHRCFSSIPSLLHLDIHNENVIVSPSRTPPLLLIDWEGAAIGPAELDFIHPLLNILGEGFRGRRFGGVSGIGSRLLDSFETGYGAPIDWEVVALHAALWYLESALNASAAGEKESTQFFLATGLGAIEFSNTG